MIKSALLVALASPVGTRTADDFTDFSNNLATDLGPLLSLFGDAMTQQYLSESTAFIDYFIFAAAPLGIIAAVVSVIRVCGHSSLRAFVGRSQEGDGAVEAELCTSTSRDVCELFNNGGTARVLGRPNILELVYIPPAKADSTCGSGPDSPRLFLFRNYLERVDESASEWTKDCGSLFGGAREPSGSATQFAPKPNLSLNIGIKRQPYWVFIVVAVIGFVLQTGVLVLAGFGAWRLDWSLNHPSSPSSQDYAPRMFIAGTLLLCLGMWSCAALIGQATQEITFRRASGPQQGRLLWLQPGPQVIGDQSFDSFAYFESPERRFEYWTSSRKRADIQALFELLTSVAVTFTVVGYVLQFIGLRGLNAWVSIAQLGSTLTMSFLRGLLCMQRLRKKDNQLGQMPDLVSGHELDWVAFELAIQESARDEHTSLSDQMRNLFASLFPSSDEKPLRRIYRQSQDGTPPTSHKEAYWHVTGQYKWATTENRGENTVTDFSPRGSTNPQTATSQSDSNVRSTKLRTTCMKHSVCNEEEAAEDRYRNLFPIRLHLSHLTGHSFCSTLDGAELQSWKDGLVRVRESSRKLAAAISQVAASILERSDWRQHQAGITLQVKVVTPGGSTTGRQGEQEIGVTVKPPAESTLNVWTVDSAQIEAVLGLWMWSLIHDRRLLYADESGNQASLADKHGIETLRIVSAGWDDGRWGREVDIQNEIDLWLGARSTELSQAILAVTRADSCGHVDLWMPDPGEDHVWVKRREFDPSSPDSSKHMLRRFFGWNVVYESLGLGATDPVSSASLIPESPAEQAGTYRVKVQFVRRRHSLLDLCVGDLFVALAGSLTGRKMRSLPAPTVVENDGHIQLKSPVVTMLEKAFVNQGLGSPSDATVFVIPSLRKQLHLHRDSMIPCLMETADLYRRNEEWDRAEVLLQSACEMEWNSSANNAASLATVLRKTCELYRWSLAQRYRDERMAFGKEGIEKIAQRYGDTGKLMSRTEAQGDVEMVADITRCYRDVADKVGLGPPQVQRTSEHHPLVQAILDRQRAEALYHLCFVNKGDFGFKPLHGALPLAVRNHWAEVIDAFLELGASPDSQDEAGRNAISYCAELCYDPLFLRFARLGAFLDLEDHNRRSPLNWAAEAGAETITRHLLQSGLVDYRRKDTKDEVALSRATHNGHTGIVQQLLDAEANIEDWDCEKDWGQAMHYAAFFNHMGILEEFFERRPRIYNANMLTAAAWQGNEAIVQYFLDKGARPDPPGNSPLCWAARDGCVNTLKLLLERGADANESNSNGITPLMFAAEAGHQAVVSLLIRYGAQVDRRDKHGETPLSTARKAGHDCVVDELLKCKATPNTSKYG